MSSFFDSASLVQIPSGYSDGTLYSVKPIDGTGDFTFSRGSDIEATRVAANGYIEKAKVNLLLQSNTFSTSWLNSSSTETSGQAGYDGTNNAWLLTATSAGGFIYQDATIGGLTTFSIYAKAGSEIGITLYSAHASQGRYFNLSTGALGGQFVGTPLDSKIESIGSGWHRCSITVSATATNNFRVYVSNGTANVTGSIYIQDAQLNYGLVAQEYVETTTTSVITGITNDMPRLDYSGGASCPSLLLEPSRQNLVTQSEYIDGLSKTGVSITSNETTSPEGVVNASKVAYTSGTAYIVGGSSLTTGVDYTFSGFFKADESPYLVVNQAGAGAKNAFYNLLDGTHSGASGITTDMVDYGNGWYRITYTDNLLYDSIRIYMSGNGSYGNYPSVGEGFFAYGFQTEQASYPTSYIPTYGTSNSRNSESCSKTGIASLLNDSEGTLFLEMKGISDGGDSRRFSISDGSINNRVSLEYDESAGRIKAFMSTGGNTTGTHDVSGHPQTDNHKIALTYNSSAFKIFIDGVLEGTDTTLTGTPIGLDQIQFKSGSGSNPMEGLVKQALVFKTALTDADAIALTTL